MECAVLTLEQHLRDSCRHTEIAVDLKRRMGIEKVREGTSVRIFTLPALVRKEAQHIGDDAEGMVAVKHTRPEVGLPAEAPSRGLVATLLESHTGGFP